MSDLKIYETGNGGSVQLEGNDLAIVHGYHNMIYLAMFGGNYESTQAKRQANKQDFSFWGNTFLTEGTDLQFNSTTERVLNEVALNSDGRLQIQRAVLYDLAFMKKFGKVDADVQIESVDRVKITITILEPENQEAKEFIFIWDGTDVDFGNGVLETPKISNSFSPASVEPATILVNGNLLSLVNAGSTLDIELIDTDNAETGNIIDSDTVQVPKAVTKSGVLFKWPTGLQYTSYYAGDAGSRKQAGWFDYDIPAYPEVIAELDDTLGANYFWRLKNDLKVGGTSNKLRFVDVNGIQDWSATNNVNAITIDKLTGLGFYRLDLLTGYTWAQHIDNALALSIVVQGVTFSDFYMMSLEEWHLIFGEPNVGAQKITDPVSSKRYMIGANNGYVLATVAPGSTANCYKQESWDYITVIGRTNTTQKTCYVFDARSLITAP